MQLVLRDPAVLAAQAPDEDLAAQKDRDHVVRPLVAEPAGMARVVGGVEETEQRGRELGLAPGLALGLVHVLPPSITCRTGGGGGGLPRSTQDMQKRSRECPAWDLAR